MEVSDFPLYLNTVAGGLDRRDQTIGGFSFVVKIHAVPVVEIIGQFLYLLGRYEFQHSIRRLPLEIVWRRVSSVLQFLLA
ncbi:MAG: hypothetical protein ACLSA5_10600 [Agathobacter rectalis]